MERCYPTDCGMYTVTPVLVASNKYCESEPHCCPRLPRCQKPVYYCCEERPRRSFDCCDPPPLKGCYSPKVRRNPCALQPNCDSYCCEPSPCKPVKTKYIMPCYRYEDGRVANQPTVLMRRACEVACGRRKRKPFVVSSYAADPHNEIRRFHAEDERGNCCYHFERNKSPPRCWGSASSRRCTPYHPDCVECQYVDSVYAHPDTESCCHFR